MHDERGSPLLGHRPGLMVSSTALSPLRSKFLIPLVATISVMSFFTQLDHLTGIADTASPGLNLTTGEKDLSVKVYSSTNSSANVALCLIVKDETPYIDEHLDYHIALGFSPIYIYDNSLDFELNNTRWYQSRQDIHHFIRLIHFPQSPVQIPAYDQCIKKDAKDSTFVALIDVDEFVVLKRHSNVVDFVEEHCDFRCGQISINWQNSEYLRLCVSASSSVLTRIIEMIQWGHLARRTTLLFLS